MTRHRLIEIVLPRHSGFRRNPGAPTGPSTITYRWLLTACHINKPITHTLRRWQRAEPLLFLLLAATSGATLSHFLPTWLLGALGAAAILGIIAGHLWW